MTKCQNFIRPPHFGHKFTTRKIILSFKIYGVKPITFHLIALKSLDHRDSFKRQQNTAITVAKDTLHSHGINHLDKANKKHKLLLYL